MKSTHSDCNLLTEVSQLIKTGNSKNLLVQIAYHVTCGYRLDGVGSILYRGKIFLSSRAHLAFYTMVTEGSFPQG
jgi:hypothetical protein